MLLMSQVQGRILKGTALTCCGNTFIVIPTRLQSRLRAESAGGICSFAIRELQVPRRSG